VTGINNLISAIGLRGDLKVEAMPFVRSARKINITSTSKSGEVTGGTSHTSKKEKLIPVEVPFISQQDPRVIKINFEGIADQVGHQIDVRDNPEKYYDQYGQAVNNAFVKGLIPLVAI